MFKLKSKLRKAPPIIDIGLCFIDKRNSGTSTANKIHELVGIRDKSDSRTTFEGNHGINWTSEFLKRELEIGGCLTFVENKEIKEC